MREQIPLTIEVHLHLRHRRLRLRHAGLRLQIRGSGGIRVRAFQHQQRLTLTYKVTEAHEHPAHTSGERKHEVREPVRVSLHLTRRRDDTDRDHGGLDRSRVYVSELGTAETDNICLACGVGWAALVWASPACLPPQPASDSAARLIAVAHLCIVSFMRSLSRAADGRSGNRVDEVKAAAVVCPGLIPSLHGIVERALCVQVLDQAGFTSLVGVLGGVSNASGFREHFRLHRGEQPSRNRVLPVCGLDLRANTGFEGFGTRGIERDLPLGS